MKLGIIGGGGLLGSTTAFYAGTQGFLSKIKLLDRNERMVMSHVMDLGQALAAVSGTKVTCADYEDLNDCDIILMTASLPETGAASRNEYLEGNLKIVADVCEKLAGCCRNKILISATNPVDVFNYVAWKTLKWDRKRMIGFCLNDTVRMQWAISETTGVCCDRIGALCIGEHGDGQVPLFNRVTVGGKLLCLTEQQRESASGLVGSWFARYQGLKSGRTSGWTSAVGLTRLIRAVADPSDDMIPCSAVLSGEYGQERLSIGVPCKLGTEGVEEIIDLHLSKQEQLSFDSAARKIKSLIAQVGY